jgi:hypothetical protein
MCWLKISIAELPWNQTKAIRPSNGEMVSEKDMNSRHRTRRPTGSRPFSIDGQNAAELG